MNNDKDYLNKIEEIMEQKRKADPLNQEMNKLFNEMFPIKQFENVFTLGYAYAFSVLKNEISKYMCEDCNEYIDAIIKTGKNNEFLNNYFGKFIKDYNQI